MTGGRALHAALLIALAGFGLTACALARRTPSIRYYTLAPSGTPPAVAGPVRVRPFTADQPYATERIAYRTSPYRLDYYTYHRWAGDPRHIMADAARDYLEPVTRADAGPPIEISGHIRRLEEVDAAQGWEGALALDLKVMREGTTVLERSYAEREPAQTQDPEAVVAALSRAFGRILDRLASEMPAGE